MNGRRKYLRYTDLHLNLAWPFSVRWLVKHINKEDPAGVFLTGDITSGPSLEFHLTQLARGVKCPIYFVLGNHDYHKRTIDGTHDDVRRICAAYPNMKWMTESGIIYLNDETALVGTEGWYDAEIGNPKWLRFTTDWILMPDLFFKDTMEERIEFFRDMADRSARLVEDRLEKAFETHKSAYVLTHVPPWSEATEDRGSLLENLWLSYNTNTRLGFSIENVMRTRKNRYVTVLAGHTHVPVNVHVRRNIECRVGKPCQLARFKSVEKIYI